MSCIKCALSLKTEQSTNHFHLGLKYGLIKNVYHFVLCLNLIVIVRLLDHKGFNTILNYHSIQNLKLLDKVI